MRGVEERGSAEQLRCVFIFRRDFRLHDNPAWAACTAHCRETGGRACPVFIFDDRQILAENNPYFSARAFSAMLDFLDDLDARLRGGGHRGLTRLSHRASSSDADLLAAMHAAAPIHAVFYNADVTPFARDRDARIRAWCEAAGVRCVTDEDVGEARAYTLWPVGSVLSRAGAPFKAFGPFHAACADRRVARAPKAERAGGQTAPRSSKRGRGAVVGAWARWAAPGSARLRRRLVSPTAAGTSNVRTYAAAEGAAILRAVARGDFDDYHETRDDFTRDDGTLRVSVYLKFGTVSTAELHAALEKRKREGAEALIRQLIWREFYYHLAAGYPEVLGGGKTANAHIRPDRQRIAWPNGERDRQKRAAWASGTTGQPLVDAAMRRLAAEGWLHNRLRMTVASHLVKAMRQDWRAGERLLARMLVDYDPAQNSGGWQSMDAQMDARAIKAGAQARRFDRRGEWVAAMRALENKSSSSDQ